MRITILSPPLNLTGGHRVKAIYAERLNRRGHEVVVVAPPNRPPSVREIAHKLVRRRPSWPRRSRSHFDGIDVECRILDRHRPIADRDVPDADVVVSTWWETAEWASRLSDAKGARAYFLQHYEAFPYLPVDRVDATWKLPMHKIVVAPWLAELAARKFGDSDVSIVPNSVDLDRFYALPRGLNSPPVVGFVYSSTPFKGTNIILKAFDLCSRRIPGLKLVTFGGEDPSPKLPLPPAALFSKSPPQEELRSFYSRCDAWLVGSRTEGFGLPILEAMACRTPVISTPAGAAPELLASGGGMLVKPEDPADMARAIEQVVTMPDAGWRTMSDAASRTASRYTWDDATDLFEAALKRCVETERARS